MTETTAGAGVLSGILAEVGLAGRMAELSRFWVLRTPILGAAHTDNLPPPW